MGPNSESAVVDSSVLVALFIDGDSNHARAYEIISMAAGHLYVPYIAVEETASILTYRLSKGLADQFITFIQNDARIVVVDSAVERDMETFLKTHKRISFADISIMSVASHMGLRLITFDKQMEREFQKAARTI